MAWVSRGSRSGQLHFPAFRCFSPQMLTSLSSWQEMKYHSDQLAFSHSSTDTATQKVISRTHAGTAGGYTRALWNLFPLFSLRSTWQGQKIAQVWAGPVLSQLQVFGPCSTLQISPLAQGCSCLWSDTYEVASSSRILLQRDSCASVQLTQPWERDELRPFGLRFFCVWKRMGKARKMYCWIVFAAVAQFLLSTD